MIRLIEGKRKEKKKKQAVWSSREKFLPTQEKENTKKNTRYLILTREIPLAALSAKYAQGLKKSPYVLAHESSLE